MIQIILSAIDEELATAWQRFCGDLDFVQVHRGSILEVECDAIVSPANSFGFMDGGIDAVYLRRFGPSLQERVQARIADKHHGELLVGSPDWVKTGDPAIPYLVVAPTMRIPTTLTNSVNAYLATRAALLLVTYGVIESRTENSVAIADRISRLAFPGMGTGVGRMSPEICARQVRQAIDDVLLGKYTAPQSWVEAALRHQGMYTDVPRRFEQSQ